MAFLRQKAFSFFLYLKNDIHFVHPYHPQFFLLNQELQSVVQNLKILLTEEFSQSQRK